MTDVIARLKAAPETMRQKQEKYYSGTGQKRKNQCSEGKKTKTNNRILKSKP